MKNLTRTGSVCALLLFACLLLVAGSATAGVIQMKNGDRIFVLKSIYQLARSV